MNWIKSGKQLLLLALLLATLITNSVSVALGQATDPAAAERLYLPLVASGATSVTPKDATDQIIVHYKDPDQAAFQTQATQMAAMSEAAGVPLDYVRELADRSVVVRLPQPLTDADLDPILAKIAQLPDVAAVSPDIRLYPQVVPNDPRYGEQWHYFAPTVRNYGVNLPDAWNVTTGAASVTVAVLDTGQLNHADLAGRMVPGYDFISDSFVANDGDGRDADPSDPGDWGCGNVSSWHGTHVAGTIGANGNNGLGVTGINWAAKIQHVRVLGICGGNLSDTIDAIRWAAGLSVPGVPSNPTPARVLNLSLGGFDECDLGMQNAIDAAVTAGAVVVVAAGNSDAEVEGFTPANCDNVITVAATQRNGDMAPYSNRGAKIEIAAPGGMTDLLEKVNGVLSTVNSSETVPEADAYAFYMGTSMATPHVAGIVSLMLSVKPTLTPAQVLSILQSTVTPFPAGSACNTSNCGAGIVNAAAAVIMAQGGLIPPNNLQVTTMAASQVTLRWNDNALDETGFKVERCQGVNCTTFATLATLGANSTSYVDTAVAANTSYSYRVRATKNGIDSAPTTIAAASTAVTTGCTIYNNTDTIRTIPDWDTLVSTVAVAKQGTVIDVNLRNLNIEHSFDADLSAVLVSPAGGQVALFNAVGGAGANFSATTLDDEATTFITNGSAPFSGSYRPSNPLSAINGQSATGLWTLHLSDQVGGYEGWLHGWSLEVCTSSSGGSDLIFEDGFESGGFGRWSSTSTRDGGDLSVSATAALVGTQGMSVFFDDTVALYVTDETPNAEARYRARFHFTPNALVMPNGAAHYIFYGYQGTSTVMMRLEFRFYNGAYQLRSALRNDSSTWKTSSWYTISDTFHALELDWRAATAPGANNGSLTFWIDGVEKGTLAGVDNDTLRVDRIRLGAIAGLDAGMAGSYAFDAFKSTRLSYIGPAVASVSASEVTTAMVDDLGANVVEEELSLDDVGLVEEDGQVGEVQEMPKQ